MKYNQVLRKPVRRDRASASRIDTLLNTTFKSYRIANKVREYSFFPHWAEIVGPELNSVTIPEKITRGKILVIRVSDAAWAQEVELRKPEIIAKLRNLASGPAIEDVRFVVSGPKGFAKQPKQVE